MVFEKKRNRMSYNVIDEMFYITLFDLDSFCHGCIGYHTNCGEIMEWMLTNYSTAGLCMQMI